MNLPASDKFLPPAYQSLEADQVTLLASADAGALVRIIAGNVADHAGPGSTHTPMALMHASVSRGAQLRLPWNPRFKALVCVLAGSGRAGSGGRPVRAGQLLVYGGGDWLSLRADDHQDTRYCELDVLILGGAPIREPVTHYGPFVMNTREQIGQAMIDFQEGRFGEIPPDALMPHIHDPNLVRAEHSGI